MLGLVLIVLLGLLHQQSWRPCYQNPSCPVHLTYSRIFLACRSFCSLLLVKGDFWWCLQCNCPLWRSNVGFGLLLWLVFVSSPIFWFVWPTISSLLCILHVMFFSLGVYNCVAWVNCLFGWHWLICHFINFFGMSCLNCLSGWWWRDCQFFSILGLTKLNWMFGRWWIVCQVFSIEGLGWLNCLFRQWFFWHLMVIWVLEFNKFYIWIVHWVHICQITCFFAVCYICFVTRNCHLMSMFMVFYCPSCVLYVACFWKSFASFYIYCIFICPLYSFIAMTAMLCIFPVHILWGSLSFKTSECWSATLFCDMFMSACCVLVAVCAYV